MLVTQLEFLFQGVILSEAVVQAERRILRGVSLLHARSLAPLVKTRGFGKTPADESEIKVSQVHTPLSARNLSFPVYILICLCPSG